MNIPIFLMVNVFTFVKKKNCFYTINDKIFCLSKSTTINANDYPYQIFKTKEYIIAQATPSKCPEFHPY